MVIPQYVATLKCLYGIGVHPNFFGRRGVTCRRSNSGAQRVPCRQTLH